MIRVSPRIVLPAAVVVLSLAGADPSAAQDRAHALLTLGRAALGKAAVVPTTAFAVTASVRLVSAASNTEILRDSEIACQVPDKYRRTETISFGGMRREVTVGAVGDTLIYNDGGMAAAQGMDPTKPGPQRDQMLKSIRLDLATMLGILLLQVPDPATYTASYVGLAEAPDGRADVIDLRGPEGFTLRLFLDVTTHRVLMATRDTQVASPEHVQAIQAEARRKMLANPSAAKDIMRESRQALERAPMKTVTIEWRLSDFTTKDGLTFPQTIGVSGSPQGAEEWAITTVAVNPPLAPGLFQAK